MDSEEFDYKAYPKAEGVKLLWHDNFWDRPLEGVCEWQNQKYHYDFQPDDHGDKVRYSMREMDEMEWLARQKQHEQFKEKVGTHCDWIYDADGKHLGKKGD